MRIVARFEKSKSGAVAIEYALIASIISIAIITAAIGLGSKLSEMLTSIRDYFL